MTKKSVINVVVLLLVFAGGVFFGQTWSVYGFLTNDDGAVEITKVIDLYSKTRSPEVTFSQFWDVWDKVKDRHVEQPVDEVKLFYGAIQGLVDGLEDPYSIYLDPERAKEFSSELSGKFEGIGAEIGIREGFPTVIAPLPGSPAEKAGLRAGDRIFAIDEDEAYGISVEEAVIKIRGKKGTPVVLTVSQNGLASAKDITIIRNTIKIPTIHSEMKEDAVGYIRISHFNDITLKEFKKAVIDILSKSPRGIILDLRSNPGGYLQTSIDVASEWIQEGTIVKERFKDGKEKIYPSTGTHRLVGMKTIILVDGGTASGSEIVAGALKDHDAAVIVGEKTFGKGSVQDFEIMPDGSALKLTIAKWFTPKDQAIEGEGIKPDVVIEKMFSDPENEDDDPIDHGLEKALELLKK